MNKDYIKKHVLGFFKAGKDKNHRFKSWEYCYRYFRWLKDHPKAFRKNPDFACVHLGFYLASWGMYRGSSFLLTKSFQIHRRPIRKLLNRKYGFLWNADIGTLSQPKTVKAVLELAKSLRELYPNHITDTLLTKILLGTIGCTPAFDRFFKDGCKKKRVRPYSNFSKGSLRTLIQFYQNHCGVFASIQKKIERSSGVSYPPMKLVDMFFWSVGSKKKYNRIE